MTPTDRDEISLLEFIYRGKSHLAHTEGHVTEFVKDDLTHAAVNKRVAAVLVLSHCPLPGLK